MTDLIILSTLLPGPKHGYQLKREASWILGQDTLHNNLVYPLLRRFTQEGWVTKKTVPGERGQTRHQYALTPLGKRTLLEKLAQYEDSESRSLEGFLTRVGQFQVLDSEARARILAKRTAHLEKTQLHLAAMKVRFPLDRFAQETIKFLHGQTESELAWIQHDCLAGLESLGKVLQRDGAFGVPRGPWSVVYRGFLSFVCGLIPFRRSQRTICSRVLLGTEGRHRANLGRSRSSHLGSYDSRRELECSCVEKDWS